MKSEFRLDENGNPAGGVTRGRGLVIDWQHGPQNEKGPNGASLEDVVDALIERVEFLNSAASGRFRCEENYHVIENLQIAKRWMEIRTEKRRKRGVEGTYQP